MNMGNYVKELMSNITHPFKNARQWHNPKVERAHTTKHLLQLQGE